MERIDKKSAVELFNSPKRFFKALDKTFQKNGTEFYLVSDGKDNYGIYDSERDLICSTDSVYNCLVGLAYFSYGYGKNPLPSWARPANTTEEEFDSLLESVNSTQPPFDNIESTLDKGGVFYYNTNESSVAFKLPSCYSFCQDVVFRCRDIQHGLCEMEAYMSILNQNNTCSPTTPLEQ